MHMRGPSDIFETAVAEWRKRSVKLLPPATSEEIAATFAKLNYPVTSDVRRLYSLTGGFVNYECDYQWSLWSLGRIVKENKRRDTSPLWFADFLICSHVYCFQSMSPSTSAVYIDHNDPKTEPYMIADSLGGFLEKYLANPDTVEAFTID